MDTVSIFIIDNNERFVSRAANFLKDHPDVSSIGWGMTLEKSLEHIERFAPDLILVDITLPKINGFETTRFLKSRKNNPKIYIIGLDNCEIYREEAIEAGADGYICKTDFIEEITKLL